jgi:hypothetical protein
MPEIAYPADEAYPEKGRSRMEEALDRLDTEIRAVASLVDEAGVRLAPVLSPPRPVEAQRIIGDDSPETSPVVERIQQVARSSSQLAYRLKDYLDRLEV